MKKPTRACKLLASFACLALLFGFANQTKALDGGIDPKNMGKGDWIWSVSISIAKLNNQVPGVTDIPSLMSYEKNQGMSFVIVKAGTGSTNYPSANSPQFTAALVNAAHNVGLKIFAYTRSYGTDLPGEIAMATNCLALGADGWIIDAESEWESSRLGTNGPTLAKQYCTAIKSAYPNRLLGHAPMPYISLHSSFPYKEFGYYSDVVMPQDYWNYIGVTPDQVVADMDSEWSNWQNGLSGIWTNAIKPLLPIGQADITNVPNSEITAFANAVINDATPATVGGYKGMSWWDAHQHSSNQWPAIAAVTIGDPWGIPDVIVDNAAATMAGSWTLGTSSADKYATDYRSKGQGTGSASLTFTPNISVSGNYKVYEWHPKGTNRTTNAPVTITYSGGSTTVKVNQQLTGGSWVLLGTFPFVAGTSGSVKITDATPDAGMLVMADAVRFAYVIPVPPAATDLTATAVTGPQINLSWTDNATDEFNYIVSRSTNPGGPFTDIATIPANSTNYTDVKVAATTTYYYSVRSENHGGASAASTTASATTDNSVADIIIDNGSTTIVGSWSIGTGAGKFGSDYRFKSQGTGAASLQYTPEIFTPGDYNIYEWHPAGGNRSVGVPYIISYNGGTVTTNVNEQINGGGWNLLGTFNLAAGQGANVKITDGFADAGQLVIADAIKFSYVPLIAPPIAPSGLAAAAAGTSQINLSWNDNSDNEDNFVVSQSATSGGPYNDIATLAANATAYNDTGLNAGTAYYYVVRAINSAGSSALSAQASATTAVGAPTAPSGLAATTVSASQINLSWTDNSNNETSFVVARSTTSGGPYTDIATVGANVTSYSNSGLSANTTYYYVVRAINGGGASANSAQDSATTLPNPPAAPSGLAASVASATQIDLSWVDNSSNETSFVVGRSATAGGPYTDIVTLGANVISYSNSGLTANTTYYYVVRASNTGGSSANSAEASATTLPNAPTTPSGLAATTVSASQINLSWADNSSNETGFVIGRSTVSGGSYVDIATLGANTTVYSDTGLSANTTYYYVVRATNTGGDSANSAQASATTLPLPPAAPTGLSASTVSASQIDLSWSDNSANETGFTIARSTVSGGPYSDVATVGANATSYSNTGLSANTTYYYVVRASNSGGSSANSAQASATTLPLPPAAPSGLAGVTVSASQVNLTWTDNASNETSVIVARSTTAGGPYTDIATLAANSVSYNDTGLSAATTYYYVVRAVNAGGASANSAEASATTLPLAPSAPSALAAIAFSSTQITLSWTDNSSNESSFIVARSTTVGGPYTDIGTVGANVTTYNDAGRTANTAYYYVIRASNAGGTSANSAEASTTTFETDLLIDNVSAVVTGNWSTGSGSTDKYGSNYRFIGAGTGASSLKYAPYVATAGNYEVYEWHPQGSNRPTNAPYVISYNGGTVTNFVNQQINGGKWNLIGTYNFAAGNSGNIKITDGFSGTNVVMADAIKLVAIPAPAAPSGLTATAASSSQINLAWTDNSSNETGFVVARSTTSGGPYTDLVTLGANVTSYNNTGLTASTTYYYVVRATGAGGSSANSAQASATTLAPIPAAPSGLTATSISTTQINLAWVDNSSNESGFIVARSTMTGGPYTDVVTTAANVTSYNNTGLAPATTYYYVVRATNSGGSSANSAQASATTASPAPAAPSGLTATAVSSSQINLSWVDNSSNESNFILARSTSSGGPYTDIATLGANVTSYNNTGLASATTYYYVVRASNGNGSSANSAQASATTPVGAPAAPSGLAATAQTPTSIKLTWVDNSSNESNFIVARSTTSGGPYTTVATLGANVTSYTNTGLGVSTTYYYVVRASNAGGTSANSAQASATTPAVADIIIDNGGATVTGTWSSGTSSTDKYGSDYRFKGAGTGTAFLTYKPTIGTAGNYKVYEWHPQGSNRTTSAPHVVTYNGGTTTVLVNQQANGGKWNLVGTYNFAAGTTGTVKITDNFTGSGLSVMADAIKFVYVP